MDKLKNNNFAEIRIPVPSGHIAGRWYGDQQKRPLLALHGWLDNCGSFAKLAPLLMSHMSVLCVDLPGHGRSSHLPVGIAYTTLEYVRTILRIKEAYNWKKVSLMGHSMGGTVCFLFAAFYPHYVDLIISLDIIKNVALNNNLIRDIMEYFVERQIKDNERMLNMAPGDEPPSYTYEECETLLHEGSGFSVERENCKYLLERNLKQSKKFPDKYYFSRDARCKQMEEYHPNEALLKAMALRICKTQLPHLVIKGTASQNFSSRSKELEDVLPENNPNFELVRIKGGTHHLHLNNADETAKIIIDFLERRYFSEKDVAGELSNKNELAKL